MSKTARFSIARESFLKNLFTVKNLSHIWRSVVKSQMRGLAIIDLHDYYDFSSNIEKKAKEIRSQILKAQYKASSPLIYKIEKKYGICRHIMIPTPSDALVFQTITDYLAPLMEKAQPTKKAYYSRDKHILPLPHQTPLTKYPWFILWPKFQKDILKFTNNCRYLVVTDITNFFDNIGLRELRHIISSRIKVQEIVLDLLFNIIEQLAWVPDYLPTSLKGLPTINIEAFRLLPHIMLFEIDEVLENNTGGNFVRWMDDINIGVNSNDEAFAILGNVNDVLKSRGLALNLSKTEIFTATEAKNHFMFAENVYLDKINKANPSAKNFVKKKTDFIRRFRLHLKNRNPKNWDKVTKRYFTIAGKLKITGLLRYSYELFLRYPSIRDSIIYYLGELGFSRQTSKLILKLLTDVKRYDDVGLYDLCKLITNIEVPRNNNGIDFIKAVSGVLKKGKSEFDLYCHIWFLAKYGEPYILMNLIESKRKQWKNEHFLARQVVSVLPRLFQFNKDIAMKLLNEQMFSGPSDASSVATSITSLLNMTKLTQPSPSLFQYLFPPRQIHYPLPKYLILLSVLSSKSLKPVERKKIIKKVKTFISDQWYLYWLKKYALIK